LVNILVGLNLSSYWQTKEKGVELSGKYEVGIDIGGTFTDVVILDPDSSRLIVGKSLTSSDNPAKAVIDVIGEMLAREKIAAQEVIKAIHGTTLVTNLIIERKGATVGLLTTRGFRDALEIGRETRYDIYDIFLELPKPLVSRQRRIEVTERMDNTGQPLTPLGQKEAERAVDKMLSLGVESAAISLLHSFRNPKHEQILRDIILSKRPGFPVSISSEVMPEIREYERTSTTVANAYAMPVVQKYLGDLQEGLVELGVGGRLYIMLSTGGIASSKTVVKHPIRLLESGPAAGALAAAWTGKQVGVENVISFDMGGTTAKTCIIENNKPVRVNEFEAGRVYRFKKGSGLPIKIQVIDMIEIGAGGGSVASVSPLGLLKVGPESAGADPGPACYGQGGEDPTVADADLILGYLDPDFFLGGKMKLEPGLSRTMLAEKLARPLNLTVEQAAWGVHEVVNENMANAARIHAAEKGIDPRRFSLVAFGGAGPVHAYQVARKLRLKTIIVPPGAGVSSAFGFLLAPMAFDLSQSYLVRLDEIEWDRLDSIYEDMEAEGHELLVEAGVAPEDLQFIRFADMRYKGQGFEVAVPVPSGRLGLDSFETLRSCFAQEYRSKYQRISPEIPVEGVNWRVTATGPRPKVEAGRWWSPGVRLEDAKKGERRAYFPETEGYVAFPVYDRYRLPFGTEIEGPAIIEERESTLIINGPGQARVDEIGNVVVNLG